MSKSNVPSEILQKEAFKTLPAKGKEEYVSNLLGKLLQLNPDGITISQIKEATELTYSTVWHHLEVLSSTAQSIKVSRGNLDVYFPTGKAEHLNDYAKGKINYTISTVENSAGKFVCMHEQRENRSGNPAVCSGIAIPVELIDGVVESLNKVKKYVKK